VAVQVLQLCQQDDLDLTRISAVISKDPALAARILRMANSPLFGSRQQIGNLSQALGLLGINAVRAVVLSFSLLRESQGCSERGLRDYWRRSVLSAFAARELCGAKNVSQREAAFLGGLLQDVGMLAFVRLAGPRYEELLRAAGGDHYLLASLEVETFGAEHVEVGAWLLERWQVPDWVVKTVAASHELLPASKQDSTGSPSLAAAVALSGLLADIWLHADPVMAAERLRREIEATFGAGAIDVDHVCAQLMASSPQVASLFDVQLDAAQMAAVLEQAREALVTTVARLESGAAILREETNRDALTGLPNRRQLQAHLDVSFKKARAGSHNLGVIFVDVDQFKEINDTYGHVAGDAVLQSVARRLGALIREHDFVGRFGGDEFVIVMGTKDAARLAGVAERLRTGVNSVQHIAGDGRTVPVAISLGWAGMDTSRHRTFNDLLEEADQALYAAKRSGGNRVGRQFR
jgi:diguanylate cyclase (GGDEF)-like protein